jgi:hypothetical protein
MGKRAAIKALPLEAKVGYGILAAALPLAYFLGHADTANGVKETPALITPEDIPGVPTSEGTPGSHLPAPAVSHADEAEPHTAPESPVADEDTQPAKRPGKGSPSPSQSLAVAKATGKPAKAASKTTEPKATHTAKPTATKQPSKPKPKPKPTVEPTPESNKGPLTSFIEDTTGISVPDVLNPLHMFLARVSDEPLAVSYNEHADTVTMTAELTDETAVQVEVTGAEDCSRKDPATVTAQTVDPQTEQPTGEPVTVDVTNPDNLSSVGIAAAVEAVLTDTTEPRQPDTSSD